MEMKKVLEKSKTFYQVRRDFYMPSRKKQFEITQYRITVPKERRAVSGRIREQEEHKRCRIRLAVLSDLHDQSYGKHNRLLLQAIEGLRPDLVLLAGDIVTAGKKADNRGAVSFIQALAAEYPVFYGLGNHEQKLLRKPAAYSMKLERELEKLSQTGVHVLDNARAGMTVKGKKLDIAGVSLPRGCYRRFVQNHISSDYINRSVGQANTEAYQILLAHTPSEEKAYRAWGADLILCGHMHGGVMRLGEHTGLITPQFKPFYTKARGCFERGGRCMIVSAGLGDHRMPLRIMNPTELLSVILEI